jgi:hypothetical protein
MVGRSHEKFGIIGSAVSSGEAQTVFDNFDFNQNFMKFYLKVQNYGLKV